jgi:hypothetical protein
MHISDIINVRGVTEGAKRYGNIDHRCSNNNYFCRITQDKKEDGKGSKKQ